MVRKKDSLWEYAEKIENGHYFICKFCQKRFAGGISRIKSHLSGVSGRDIQICQQVPETIQLKAKQALPANNVAIDTTTKRAKNVAASNNVLESERISGRGQDKSTVDQNLVNFLTLERICPQAIQSPFFIDFVKGIAKFGPNYVLPSYSTLKFQLMPDIKEKVAEYVQNIINCSVKTGCTLMFNVCPHEKKFVDIFACTPIGVACIEPSLSFIVSSFENFSCHENTMFSIMEFIGPTNVVQLITNGDNDEVSSTKDKDMLRNKYPWIYQTRCAARGIRLLLEKIYDVPYVYNTIRVARWIFSYIYNHKINVSLRRRVRKKGDLLISNVLKLISILEVESKLQALEVSSAGANFIDYVIHCKEFWSRGKMVAKVMQSLIQAHYLVHCDGPTLGYLYEMMERVQDAVKQCRDSNKVIYDNIWKILEEARSDIIYPIHGAAAFLNPIYMRSEKFKENDEMKNSVNHILKHLVAVEENKDFMNQVQLYSTKDSNVFTAEAMMMLETCHPRIWWECCGNHLPVLQKYAIRILSQPCNSSLCRYELRKWDNNDHVFMVNTLMMERYKSRQGQTTEPIILDELGEVYEVYEDIDFLDYRNSFVPPLEYIREYDPTCSWVDKIFEKLDRLSEELDELSEESFDE